MEEQFETFSRSFADAYAQLQLSSKMSAGSEDIPPSPNAVILDVSQVTPVHVSLLTL